MWPLLFVLSLLFELPAPALSTGQPIELSVSPATVRQGEKDESPVQATVVLKVPSPGVFVCQLRSSNPGKVLFGDIIFAKGELKGQSAGVVKWKRVPVDCSVQISAFSVDEPDEKVWFTISLKAATAQ